MKTQQQPQHACSNNNFANYATFLRQHVNKFQTIDSILMINLFSYSFLFCFVHFRLEQSKRLIEQNENSKQTFFSIRRTNKSELNKHCISLHCTIASKVIKWLVNVWIILGIERVSDDQLHRFMLNTEHLVGCTPKIKTINLFCMWELFDSVKVKVIACVRDWKCDNFDCLGDDCSRLR